MQNSQKKTQNKKITKIAFDIDGVLCDFNSEYIKRVNSTFNLNIDPNKIPSYDYISDLLGQEKADDFFALEISRGLFADCLPYPEAQIFMFNLLADNKHEVYFITARGTEKGICWDSRLHSKMVSDTRSWLKENFPNFNQANLIFSGRKDETIYKNNIQLMVEDKKSTAEALTDLCKSVLLTRSWNTGDTTAIRVSSIAEVGFLLK